MLIASDMIKTNRTTQAMIRKDVKGLIAKTEYKK